jgi:transposase
MIKTCPYCARPNGGQFPDEVKPGVQYGTKLKSLVVYLVQYHLLPWQRTCELIGDLFGQQIAEGTLQAALEECAGELQESSEQIKEAIIDSSVVHFDETGFYVAGRREWLHVASTPTLTYYSTHPKRGAEATTRIGILPGFGGRAVHDAWSSYFTYSCSHALCNAHHLRELTFVAEQMKQSWAEEFKELLLDIKQAVEQARAAGLSALPQSTLKRFAQQYDRLILVGLELPDNLTPAPSGKRGPTKKSKSRNLLDRLSRYKAETLAFMFDFSIPFDNNQAVRSVLPKRSRDREWETLTSNGL